MSFDDLQSSIKLVAAGKTHLKIVFVELFASVLLNTVILLATALG